MAKDGCGPKCIILGLVSAAFMAGALWTIVGGIWKQWTMAAPMSNIFLWYFGGFILFCIAKCIKMKTCEMCRV